MKHPIKIEKTLQNALVVAHQRGDILVYDPVRRCFTCFARKSFEWALEEGCIKPAEEIK